MPEKPHTPDDSLALFAENLRQLRHHAGDISYRSLAERVQMSPSALSQAASGRKLPTWNVTRAFVRGCGGNEKVWYAQWSQVRQELNARQTNTTNGQVPPSALDGKAPESAPHTTGMRLRPVPVRVAVLVAMTVIVLISGLVVINWRYGQEEADPTAAGPPAVITTYIHGNYEGVAGLYATPRPAQAEINNPPYTVKRTGELNIVCQVPNGTVMKAVLFNDLGVAREEENDIWYHVIPSNYYIPAIYTTFPYGVEGMLPPGQPFGTIIPNCTDVP